MDFDFSVFSTANAWISLLTLTFLELVLGVDNIIFISLVAGKLQGKKQRQARNIGLLLAMVIRIILLFFLGWIIGLTEPIFSLPLQTIFEALQMEHPAASAAISGRDLILLIGGFFLLAKSTTEIHGKVSGKEEGEKEAKGSNALLGVLLQIALIDVVFSFDSILTAVGLTQHLAVMILAVVLSMLMMMLFSGAIGNFINKYPTLQILALSFLIMIGLTLILEGFDMHVNKAFVYISVLFSLFVEFLNIRFRKSAEA